MTLVCSIRSLLGYREIRTWICPEGQDVLRTFPGSEFQRRNSKRIWGKKDLLGSSEWRWQVNSLSYGRSLRWCLLLPSSLFSFWWSESISRHDFLGTIKIFINCTNLWVMVLLTSFVISVGWILKPSVNNENNSKWRGQEDTAGPSRTERYIYIRRPNIHVLHAHTHTHTYTNTE